MKNYNIEFENDNHIFKVVVPAKNLGQAIIGAWKLIKDFADNLITYNIRYRPESTNDEIGWKYKRLEKEEE